MITKKRSGYIRFALALGLTFTGAAPVAFGASSSTSVQSSTTTSTSSVAASASTSASANSSTKASSSASSAPKLSNLTSLASISTSVTGLQDSTFLNEESSYHQSLTASTGWRGFSHQGGRDITLTFKKPVDIEQIQMTALQNPSIGVYFPGSLDFQFQVNGKWVSAGKRYSAFPASGQKVLSQPFTWTSQAGIEATAVRISFPVSVWVFVHGLEVQGSTTQTGASAQGLTPVLSPPSSNTAMSPDAPNASNIHNMLLVETGGYGSDGTWSESEFEPMVTYEKANGTASGSLFDTILFLPYGNVPKTEASLQNYISNLFLPNQQLVALNQAVAKTNETLKRPGYQEKVVLTIPYFRYGAYDFGQLNGTNVKFGGSSSDPNAVAARQEALSWYLTSLMQAWKKADLKNLKLVGLYWAEEQYHPASPGEQDYLNSAIQTVHGLGLPLYWIPFYGADKSDQWKNLGFNAAWIQPNYVEQRTAADVIRISNAMETAKLHNMGIEVELTGLDGSSQELYDTFLQKLLSEGFASDQVSHAFYDGSKLLVTAAKSSDPMQREVYDATASFIQGK